MTSASAAGIEQISAAPLSVPSGVPTSVVVSARFASDPGLIGNSVTLLRYNSNGVLIGSLGVMVDDGTGLAFQKTLVFNEQGPNQVILRVSAAYRGQLKRTISSPLLVPVAINGVAAQTVSDLAASLQRGDVAAAYGRLGTRLNDQRALDGLSSAQLRDLASSLATCTVSEIRDYLEICQSSMRIDGVSHDLEFTLVKDAFGIWRVIGW